MMRVAVSTFRYYSTQIRPELDLCDRSCQGTESRAYKFHLQDIRNIDLVQLLNLTGALQ